MKSLKKNIGVSFIGNIVYALSQWLLLVILAKLSGEEILGVYALALAVVSPVFALANMNLRALQATDAEKTVHFDCYGRFRRLSSLIAILICSAIAVIIYRDKLDISLSIICLSFYKYFESQSDLVHGFLQKRERMDLIANSIMARGFSNVLVMATTYYFTHELTYALAVTIIKSWAIYYFIDRRNYRRLYQDQPCDYKTVSELFRVAWPLGIVIFANTLNLNIPRYFIALYYGESLVGIFAAISYFIVAGSTLVNAIGQSAVPRLAKQGLKNLPAFQTLSRQVFLLITLVGMVGVLIAQYLGDWILRLAYTNTISEYHVLFVQIMWAGVAVYSSTAIGCSLTALRDFKSQSLFAIINVLVMLFSAYWLTNKYGLTGAAAAIFITYFIKLIMAWLRIKHILKNKIYEHL